jgi:hypothetical protein
MESISPITLRKALDALALPARASRARDDALRSRTLGWSVLLAVALCAACAFSVWR